MVAHENAANRSLFVKYSSSGPTIYYLGAGDSGIQTLRNPGIASSRDLPTRAWEELCSGKDAAGRFGGGAGEVHVYGNDDATIERSIVIDGRGQYPLASSDY